MNSKSNDRASLGKIFIGGLPKETEYNKFNKHFGKYGDIKDSVIMKKCMIGQPRGVGFITYAKFIASSFSYVRELEDF
ncbi:heterogeneous nuclear ribonucleoprotein 1 [Tanacetum coccineum]